MMALKMLLVRVNLAGICLVLGVTEETVLAWLRRAAHQAEAINRHLLRALPVTQVQLDERWNFIERKHACETDAVGESLPEGKDGRQWVWISFAPEFRLMIAVVVGPRTLDTGSVPDVDIGDSNEPQIIDIESSISRSGPPPVRMSAPMTHSMSPPPIGTTPHSSPPTVHWPARLT